MQERIKLSLILEIWKKLPQPKDTSLVELIKAIDEVIGVEDDVRRQNDPTRI